MTDHSRRSFLKTAGSAAGGSWLAVQWPALLAVAQVACTQRDAQAPFVNLSAEEAAALEALAEQIMPTDDTPGAREVGVIWFIDQAAGGFMADAMPMLRDGIDALNNTARIHFGDQARFAELDFEQQHAVVDAMAQPSFWEGPNAIFLGDVHFLTMAGMFAMPSHGGNLDLAGWRLLGFDHRHAWQPPFGAYDG